MKLKDFLKQFEGLDQELEVGLFINSMFKSNLHHEIIQIELDWDNEYVKAFNQRENNKKVIVIAG